MAQAACLSCCNSMYGSTEGQGLNGAFNQAACDCTTCGSSGCQQATGMGAMPPHCLPLEAGTPNCPNCLENLIVSGECPAVFTECDTGGMFGAGPGGTPPGTVCKSYADCLKGCQ
jgi:hypothetical protein